MIIYKCTNGELIRQVDTVINSNLCAWLAPNGSLYICGYYEHVECADIIASTFNLRFTTHVDLMDYGYIHIGRYTITHADCITQPQIDMLGELLFVSNEERQRVIRAIITKHV